jgi:predicted secreted protein with PEFG-CTERM motif
MTDKPTYSGGDQITISGTVSAQLNVPISIVIKDPSQHIVELGQVSVNAHNTYSTQMTAGGSLWAFIGTYEVDVTYGSKDNTAKTTFAFAGNTMGTSGNMTGTSGNQTVPEFGQMASIVLAVSIMSLVLYMRVKSNSRTP